MYRFRLKGVSQVRIREESPVSIGQNWTISELNKEIMKNLLDIMGIKCL